MNIFDSTSNLGLFLGDYDIVIITHLLMSFFPRKLKKYPQIPQFVLLDGFNHPLKSIWGCILPALNFFFFTYVTNQAIMGKSRAFFSLGRFGPMVFLHLQLGHSFKPLISIGNWIILTKWIKIVLRMSPFSKKILVYLPLLIYQYTKRLKNDTI